MTVIEQSVEGPTQHLTASDLYQDGYRARRTGKRTGEMTDPIGATFHFNTFRQTCSCGSTTRDGEGKQCVHLLFYVGLRCEQNARKTSE